MRGLLLKDCYTLLKQMKIVLAALVVFACMPGYSMSAFAIIYAAMLPMAALAYDERSKWDELAVMMPYSAKSIVLSKYLFGGLAILAALVLSVAAQFVLCAVKGSGFPAEEAVSLLLLVCLALLFLAVNLPIMFKLGVEKGRLIFLLLMAAAVVSVMALYDRLSALQNGLQNQELLLLGALLLAAVSLLVSVPLSVYLYKKKRG